MKKRRIPALLLAIVLLTGCQQPAAQNQEAEDNSALLTSQYVYQAQYVPLQDTGLLINGLSDACFSGENLYFTAERGTGKRVVQTEYEQTAYPGEISLLCLDQETNEPILLADHTTQSLPEGAVAGALDVLAITPGEDGTVWVWQQLFTCDEAETGTVHTPQLCQYAADGSVLQCMEVPEPALQYIYRMERDIAGNFAVFDGESLYLIDGQGRLRRTLTPDPQTELCSHDGAVGCLTQNEAGETVFRPLDLQTGVFGTDTVLNETVSHLYPGNAEYSYLYDLNGDAVYGCRADDGTSERLLTWSDYGVLSSGLLAYGILSSGDIRGVVMNGVESAEAVYLKRVDPSLVPEQTVLTMACLNGMAEFIQSDVIAFNRTHPTVKISIVDYEEFDAGETLLYTQILSGNGPDLFYMDSMVLMALADTGALQDLWPMIDADAELSRDDLMTHVFDVMSKDDRLYGVAASFTIQTAAVLAENLPDQTGWTLEEMLAARERAGNCPGVFGSGDTRSGLLYRLVGHNSGDFLNWEEGECCFDTPEFEALLEFVKEFPEDSSAVYRLEELERIREKEQLCAELFLQSFADFKYALEVFGRDVRFVGYPSQTGQNYFRLSGSFGIAAGCENTEAAWEFGRMLLTESYQRENYYSFGFPTNKTIFDRELSEAMFSGKSVWDKYWLTDGDSHQTAPLTQADHDRFMALYESCDRTMGYDDAVMTIVFDESEYFFNGHKSAEETAEMIQERVSLYMAERKVTS